MGQLIVLALMLVLVTATVMTMSPIEPETVKESSKLASEDKDSSSSSSSSEESGSNDSDDKSDDDSFEAIKDKERMLCNVIVRATHDLRVYQSKSADEIINYLDADCKNLENEELIEQCHEMVSQHGAKIYEDVANGKEMSSICKSIEDGNEIDFDDEGTTQCTQGSKDKCKCCIVHVEKRKMRLRFIVKQMAKKRMARCEHSPRPQRCRHWIRRKTFRILKKIRKICPHMVCKHLGYCETDSTDNIVSPVPEVLPKIAIMLGYPSLSVGLLDKQLEAHLTQNVCNDFEQLQPLCVHVAASVDSRRYTKLYMAILNNDTKWIDDDIRKQVQSAQSGANTDLCDTCKNVVQSSKTFFLQALDSIHTALDTICEKCPSKDKCKEFFKSQFDTITTYVNQLKPDEFCSKAGLCSVNNIDESCATCAQFLQQRKDAAALATKQVSAYFTDRCTEWNIPDCQQFFSEVLIEVTSYINELDVQGTCQTMGFCGKNAVKDVEDYERAFVDDISKNICPTLGPFEALCQQVVQGNSKLVQTITINPISVNDFLQSCDEENTAAAAPDSCSNDQDKCKCCIAHVAQKKICLKKRVAKYISHMIELCKRAPAQDKCVHYWEAKKACWDGKIDKICPKKACTRMGFCKKEDTSSICAYMGPFKQICEQTHQKAGQLLGKVVDQAAAGTSP